MSSTDSFGNAVVGLQLPQNFCVLKSETPAHISLLVLDRACRRSRTAFICIKSIQPT